MDLRPKVSHVNFFFYKKVVFFKNEKLKISGIFGYSNWQAGLYGTSSLLGSKPSASVIGAWVASLRLGREGLKKNTKKIRNCLISLKKGLREIKGLEIVGEPEVEFVLIKFNVIAFYYIGNSKHIKTFKIHEGLNKKFGWDCGLCQRPIAVRYSITLGNLEKLESEFIRDVKKVMSDV